MKGKRAKTEIKTKSIKKIIVYILLIIFLTTMIISGTKIFKWLKENKENEVISKQIKKTVSVSKDIESVEKYNINFEMLKKTNTDTVAWIKVNGTNIEYPIVKTTNNDFYLAHSFDKSYNSAGWAFMDYLNKNDGTDKNIIIYAHNRRDGSLFGTLKNILSDEWQNNEDNFIIPFITENEKVEYQVFSVYKIEDEDYYLTKNFENDEEFQNFIYKIKSRSEKKFNVEVSTEDNILTLSTCADDNRYRVVLHAKKIKT